MNIEYPVVSGNSFRLNLQMMLDAMEDLNWKYIVHRPGETPCLSRCMLYYGQSLLAKDVLYIVSEESARDFPADQFCYITTSSLRGDAPHIRCAERAFPELVNYVMAAFSYYSDFERALCNTISGGGSLSELCCVASKFLRNPVYVHDNVFCVIGQSPNVEDVIEFEYSEKTKKAHIPLWLINELKFDEAYKSSLQKKQAGIWGNDQDYSNVRSLYVNLWEGEEYLGRVLINEIETSIRPGQFRAAEFFAGYVILWMKNLALSNQQINYSFEQTFIDLLNTGETDVRDLKAILGILDWKFEDRYLCLKFQNQDAGNTVRPDIAVNTRLSSAFSGYFSFRHQQKLCVIINLTVSGIDLGELRLRLAPIIRDSCLYVGISNPIEGIHSLYHGFVQADISLDYITCIDSSDWMVLFSSCALNYIRESSCVKLPAKMVVHPVILDLIEHPVLRDAPDVPAVRKKYSRHCGSADHPPHDFDLSSGQNPGVYPTESG